MKILLDECLDWRLGGELVGHDVKTVQEMGWEGVQNGRLLALAEQRFEVFITADHNLFFQQNPGRFAITVVVLRAQSLRLLHTKPLMSKVRELLPTLQPGTLITVPA